MAPSYEAFLGTGASGASGGLNRCVGADALLAQASSLAGMPVDLVAIDMPLARSPIVGRRASDNAISRQFGAAHCSTHTPSVIRPGALSDDLRASFEAAGYSLVTTQIRALALIEVYPHPALLALTGATRRLPYKHGNIRKYWRELSRPDCVSMLLATWAQIIERLEDEIEGVVCALSLPAANGSPRTFKAFEDQLDAIVCAWVGARVLEGSATAWGDEESAIWVPDMLRSRLAQTPSSDIDDLPCAPTGIH